MELHSYDENLRNPNNVEFFDLNENQRFSEDFDSNCSTPYVSAPSSPGRNQNNNINNNNNGYFFSAPASPMHFILNSSNKSLSSCNSTTTCSSSSSNAFLSSSSELSGSFEFDFSARFSSSSSNSVLPIGSMISADELFLNGQIRPMKLSSHLQRPQVLAPLLDLEAEDEEEDKDSRELQFVRREESMVRGRDLRLRNRSLHRRARSLSPLRNTLPYQWQDDDDDDEEENERRRKREFNQCCDIDLDGKKLETPSTETTPSVSAASSRSSSSGRSSKRWEFLKDFLRSKSEGRGGNVKDKFWYSISFSPTKDKRSSNKSSLSTMESQKSKNKTSSSIPATKKSLAGKPANGVSKRRVPPSPHELHYTAKRAQAEEMKKKTYLPYRQGLLGCLGFSSKGYGAMNGFARSLNPVSSR
ncbi:hypothetical protein AQUCO_00300587v1 [Aquilegia coerulea]|uniref:Uncharacterized protein n=1 Tax=Aquilegia coerulea TaxID=218851 RepID=A0A2G5EZG9_AQUCA|nr:hypothetical protein AQUCO_00300587v1 [Aquilegia coerulea]